MALDQPHGHIADVCCLILRRAGLHRLNYGEHFVVIVLDLRFPIGVNILVPTPNILDPGLPDSLVVENAVGLGQGNFLVVFRLADGRFWHIREGLVGRKGRVNGNQVNALVVEGTQER